MRFRIVRLAALPIVLFLLMAACALQPQVTDTGYTGTWARGNDRARSVIAIVRDGSGYRFRWYATSSDGKWTVRCDWNGNCEERVDGRVAAIHHFRPWLDPKTGHLMVDWSQDVSWPRKVKFHSVDELVVEPDGRGMWSYTLERTTNKRTSTYQGDGRPKRRYRKVADMVADPPPGAGR